MTPEFDKDRQARFKKLVAKYEQPRCALLPVLHLAQEQFGYLTPETMDYVAGLLDIPPREVVEAVTFYTMFRRKDMGKWCVQICKNITCQMMNADELIKIAKEELGVSAGETTEDKQLSWMGVECIGACDQAPVIQVNETYHERIEAPRFRQLLKDLRAGKEPAQ